MIDRFNDIEREAPSLPTDTCPAIDTVQIGIRGAMSTARLAAKHCEHDASTKEFDAIEYQLGPLNDELESLRRANGDLRDAAVFWHDRCREVCAELDMLAETAGGEGPPSSSPWTDDRSAPDEMVALANEAAARRKGAAE